MKTHSLNEVEQLRKLTEALDYSSEEWTLRLIARAIELAGYELSPEQVLNDFKKNSPQFLHMISDMDANRWLQHIEWTYDAPEPTDLRKKIYNAGTEYLNCEVYVDDVEDWLRDNYGDKAEAMSVDQIAKILKKGDWCHTGEL